MSGQVSRSGRFTSDWNSPEEPCRLYTLVKKMGGPRTGLDTIVVKRKSPPSTWNRTPTFPPVTSLTETMILLLWISVLSKMCIVPPGISTNTTQTTSRVSEAFQRFYELIIHTFLFFSDTPRSHIREASKKKSRGPSIIRCQVCH